MQATIRFLHRQGDRLPQKQARFPMLTSTPRRLSSTYTVSSSKASAADLVRSQRVCCMSSVSVSNMICLILSRARACHFHTNRPINVCHQKKDTDCLFCVARSDWWVNCKNLLVVGLRHEIDETREAERYKCGDGGTLVSSIRVTAPVIVAGRRGKIVFSAVLSLDLSWMWVRKLSESGLAWIF